MDIHLIEEIENFSIREELSKYIYLDNRSDAQYISYYQQEIYPKLSWLNKKRAMKPERMILIHQWQTYLKEHPIQTLLLLQQTLDHSCWLYLRIEFYLKCISSALMALPPAKLNIPEDLKQDMVSFLQEYTEFIKDKTHKKGLNMAFWSEQVLNHLTHPNIGLFYDEREKWLETRIMLFCRNWILNEIKEEHSIYFLDYFEKKMDALRYLLRKRDFQKFNQILVYDYYQYVMTKYNPFSFYENTIIKSVDR